MRQVDPELVVELLELGFVTGHVLIGVRCILLAGELAALIHRHILLVTGDVEGQWVAGTVVATRFQDQFVECRRALRLPSSTFGGNSPNTGEIFAGIRVSTLNGGKEYGFFFPAIPADQESRAATWLFGLQQNAETRSNLAIVNLGTEPNRFIISFR